MPTGRPLVLAALCTLAVALAACGGNPCLVTTTGAASSSMKCSVAATRSAQGVHTVVITVPGAKAGTTYFSFKLDLGQAAPTAITYTKDNTSRSGTGFGDCSDGAGCFIQFFNQKNSTGEPLPDIGTFSVALTAVEGGADAAAWTVSGSAEMTMVPSLGNGAGASAKVTF
jgi:hypothetical protein